MMKKLLFTLLLTAFVAVSCGPYHAGVTLPKDQRTIALERVVNLTSEAPLTPLFKNAFIQRLENTTGIRTCNHADKAALVVSVKIKDLTQSRAASTLLRDHKDRDKSDEAYQTVLFRLEVTWEYVVTVTKTNKELVKGSFVTTGDVPKMPDLEMSRKPALKEAARAAAEKLTWIITER